MSELEFAHRQVLSTLILPTGGPVPARAFRSAEGAGGGAACRLGDASCASAQAGSLQRAARGGEANLHRSLRRLQHDHGNHFVGAVLRQAGAGGAGGGDMDAVERSIGEARGGGHGMDHATRTRMESSFGADFSGVRIHTDARADALSESLSARAFTTGQDVFFRQGEYNPGATSGRELLAHELTHVVQQNGPGLQRKMTVSQPGDPHEVEADRMASEVMRQEHDDSALQRQPEADKPHDEDEKKTLHPRRDAGFLG